MTVADEVAKRTRPWARKRLLLKLAPYIVTTTLLVLLASVSMDILSAVRAYVEGESLWSKAQKESVRQLEHYAASGDAAAYQNYLQQIQVPLGDRRAGLELERERPQMQQVVEGFRAGRIHPDDIPLLVGLFRRFRHVSFMDRAITIWATADREIDEIVAVGDELHELFDGKAPATGNGRFDRQAAIAHALARLRAADSRATPLEERFSATLGDASRQVRSLLQVGMLLLALVLVTSAVALSLWMWRRNTEIERELRLSEERFDMAVRGSNDGIWNWNADDDEAYLSPRAQELLGLSSQDLAPDATSLLARVHAEDRELIRNRIRDTLRDDLPLDLEFRFTDSAGEERWAHVRGRLIRTSDGRVKRVAGSISDISERKRADELRRQLAADEQRRSEQAQIALLEKVQGRMGRELHDDLGQQLTGVAFLAKALEQRLGSASSEREQTAWIVRLINDAIDRVRFMSRQLSPIAIDEVTLGTALQRLVDDIHGIFGTRIELRKTGDETQIPGSHASQFFRIALESITNALRHGRATAIGVHLHARGNKARLAVIDNGCGFDVSGIDLNASLGLRSMAIRAEALQGRIRIRSSPRGTYLVVRSRSLDSRTGRAG
jgi:PAS domain S-box-containing protein